MNIISKLTAYLKDNPDSSLSYFLAFVYRSLGRNKVKVTKGNTLQLRNAYMKKCKIYISGTNNVVEMGGANYLTGCFIYITGSNNHIILGNRNVFINGELWIEDSRNTIRFGSHNRILGKTHVAALEGTEITFGDDCLFSTDVVFRTSDSHSILDVTTGQRVNQAESIHSGNHVWFGNKTTILKGVNIEDDCIVGTGSIVTKSIPIGSAVAGNPAKVLRSGITWDKNRV